MRRFDYISYTRLPATFSVESDTNTSIGSLWHRSIKLKSSPVFRALLPGVLLGFLLGLYMRFDTQDFSSNGHRFSELTPFSSLETAEVYGTNVTRDQWLFLHCVVVGSSEMDKTTEKFFFAIQDTYTRKCNRTTMFVRSHKLQEALLLKQQQQQQQEEQKVSSENQKFDVYFLDSSLSLGSWSLLQRIVSFLSEPSLAQRNRSNSSEKWEKEGAHWTVISDERNYVLVDNARHFLSSFANHKTPKIVGRIHDIRSPLNFLFPFSRQTALSMETALFLNAAALKKLVSASINGGGGCSRRWWFLPSALGAYAYSGKALMNCASQLGISLLDPVDEEGHPLIIGTNIRLLFSRFVETMKTKRFNISNGSFSEECCSDRAISLGRLSYKDQRTLDFVLSRLRVFGVS